MPPKAMPGDRPQMPGTDSLESGGHRAAGASTLETSELGNLTSQSPGIPKCEKPRTWNPSILETQTSGRATFQNFKSTENCRSKQ